MATKSCRKPSRSAPTWCMGTGAPGFLSQSPALSQERHLLFAPDLRKDRLFTPSELAKAMTFLREDCWALLLLLSASETLPEHLQRGKPFHLILSTASHRAGTTAICLSKHLGGLKHQLEPVSLGAGQSWSKTMIPAPKRLIQLILISTCKRLLSSKHFLATKSPGTSVRLISVRRACRLPGGKRRHSGKG